jgi:hypothetical protein
MVFSGIILGFIMSKEGKIMDPKKVEALVNMLVFTTRQEINFFYGMAQFCRCFINFFASIMSPIIKLVKKFEVFEWTKNCKNVSKEIKNQYM